MKKKYLNYLKAFIRHKKYANLNLSTPEQFNRFLRRFFLNIFQNYYYFLQQQS